MGKLIKLSILIVIMAMLGTTVVSFAGSDAIKVKLDGADIVSDSPPVIVDGRTLIPARALFEAMGGTVYWNEAFREVEAIIGDVTVRLKIDSKSAYINGMEKNLDVPARIMKNRTMIPVRFVTEAAGCKVSWDEKYRIVNIASSDGEEGMDLALISGIEYSALEASIVIEADREITDFTSFKLANPNRLVVDIREAILDEKKETVVMEETLYFKSIRYSQLTQDTVRIVADLASGAYGTISRSDSGRAVSVSFALADLPGKIIEPDGSISEKDKADLDRYGLSPIASEAQHKLVVIDPGHGGADPGARGFENGIAVLNEKDVNLDIALRIKTMLEAAGARFYMIRTEDITIPLYDRQDTANILGASLYVSIHNNSYTSGIPNGTEVHYYGKDNPPVDGISAMELANNMQKTLVANLGLMNRGAKASPELAVLRRTVMPAVIIEGGFLSNTGDLNYMKTDDFRENYAKSVAKCIIDTLNNSVGK